MESKPDTHRSSTWKRYNEGVFNKPALFGELFATQPPPVRHLLRSALHIDDLEQVYLKARTSGLASLSQSMLETLSIRVQVSERDLGLIPRKGPVIAVANHPHGILDGIALDQVLSRCRDDFKVLANDLIGNLNEARDRCIRVDVLGGEKSSGQNLRAVREALSWVRAGHAIAIFPSGEVSHWLPAEKRVADPLWNDFAVRCARLTQASISPIFMGGGNSLAFQMAGLIHPSLRTARLPVELLKKRASTVEVRIGQPITLGELLGAGSEKIATEYVRARVYMLGQRTASAIKAPHSDVVRSEETRRAPCSRHNSVAAYARRSTNEISRLDEEGHCVVQNESYAVYSAIGAHIPRLLPELGRLREFTFRKVGEGTGNELDLDTFDGYYTHLILWHKKDQAIAGAYRLAWTDDVIPAMGINGLYTSKLFRYTPQFFSRIGPAVELGRSFVSADYQKEFTPLLLLWQAICRCVAKRPDSPLLFGAVSISASYSDSSRELIVNFLQEHSFRADLAKHAVPRNAFRSHLIRKQDLQLITKGLASIDDLPIGDLEAHSGVPILLRQYLRLGGRVAAFNVDIEFSSVLDALLVSDLRQAPRKFLARYMGDDLSRTFLHASNSIAVI